MNNENNNQIAPILETSFAVAQRMLQRAWQEIDQQMGNELDRSQRSQLLRDLRKVVLPSSRRGRKPEPTITAAVGDFQTGLPWESLYEKYIPGWKGMHQARRNYEARALEYAIQGRLRRDKELSHKGASELDIVLESNTPRRTAKTRGRKLSDISKLDSFDESEIEFVEA